MVLKQLTRERDQIVDERTVAKNRLHAEEKEAFPNINSIKRIKALIKFFNKQEKEIKKQDSQSNFRVSSPQDLIDEGLAREVVNRIQKSRKELHFNVGDRITVYFQGSSEIEKVIEKFKTHIGTETLTMEFIKSPDEQPLKYEIDEFKLTMKLKVNA
jgi:hypothetical protein